MTLPQHHPSPTCRPTKPSVTTQPSLLSLCAGILSSQANSLAAAKYWKQDDPLSTGCLVFLPWTWCELLDAQMVSWPQELPVWVKYLLSYLLPLPSSCVKLWGGAGSHWPHRAAPLLCPTSQKPFQGGTLVMVNCAEYLLKSTSRPSLAKQNLAPRRGAAASLPKRGAQPESSPHTSSR